VCAFPVADLALPVLCSWPKQIMSNAMISNVLAVSFASTIVAFGPVLNAAQNAVSHNVPKSPGAVERLGPDTLRVGNLLIDTAKKEVSIMGTVTEAITLEFIAVRKGGIKAYESALELETTGIDMNLGLILIGLDPSRAVGPKFHIDPTPPLGDPVEIWVEWDDAGMHRKVRAEELIFNLKSKQTLTEGPWVYTGSAFTSDSNSYFMAELDGTLIGFVHSPSPLIDSPRLLVEGEYGENRLNPSLNLKPGTSVMLTVRALARSK
jgi:hypothetical protein